MTDTDRPSTRELAEEVLRRAEPWTKDPELPAQVVRLQLLRLAREVLAEHQPVSQA